MWKQLHFSDEFRMRSPIGWLCFGVLVACVIIVESGVSVRSYPIVHGQSFAYPGQVFQRIVPTVGYRSNAPQIIARRVNVRNEDFYTGELNQDGINEDGEGQSGEEEGEEEGGEEDEDNRYEQNYGPPHPDQHRIEEELEREREEEEQAAEENGEFDNGEVSDSEEEDSEEDYIYAYINNYGRQANKDDKIQLNSTAHKQNPIRVKIAALQKSSKKGEQKKNNKKPIISKKKKPIQSSEDISPIKSDFQEATEVHKSNDEQHKQKLQLNAIVSHSHSQYIATPIADLILRLSISLAKPIGLGNGTSTYLNVPVRISSTENEEKNNSMPIVVKKKVEASQVEKINPPVVNAGPVKVVTVATNAELPENQESDDKQADEEEEEVST